VFAIMKGFSAFDYNFYVNFGDSLHNFRKPCQKAKSLILSI
jgi:hypothetical protein